MKSISLARREDTANKEMAAAPTAARKERGLPQAYNVKGVNATTGQVVELTVLAETALDAKRQVEACGLRYVVVTEPPQPPTSQKPDPSMK